MRRRQQLSWLLVTAAAFALAAIAAGVSRDSDDYYELDEPEAGRGDPDDVLDDLDHRRHHGSISKKIDEYEDEDEAANDLNNPTSTSSPQHKKSRLPKVIWSFDDRFKFTKPFYTVTIAENAAGKTYVAPKISTTIEPGLAGLDASPYAKMGIEVGDPALVVRYKIIGGDDQGRKIFAAEARQVGQFWFLRIRTRAIDIAPLNREYRDNFHLKIRATIVSLRDPDVRVKARCDVFVEVEDANGKSSVNTECVLVPEISD